MEHEVKKCWIFAYIENYREKCRKEGIDQDGWKL